MSSPGTRCRRCSRQTCTRDAVMTLTYVYSDSTAVVGPLAGHAEPHAYDLCSVHADRLTVPRGWRVVRLELPETRARREDIGAVAAAVRETEPEPPAPVRGRSRTVLRDVSLPRTAGPAQRQGRGTTSAQREDRESESVRDAGPARPQGRQVASVPRSSRETGSAPRPDREAVAGPARRDVPMPEGLYRAHLRRPAGGADRARPGT